ncbi:hypothetical protein HF086_009751 [Spodoptera exigua]|uniref:C2H2-type domain-containing protein n=1 Tax=Spodoptera exigua TaxID=7107 RepID=A0A922MBM9_SPOEX|nr:hypothetical protein HF086_009751 [Spodoptera exigua]
MTNAQIIDILQSEFGISIKSSHELEVNIYIKIIKRYLKDWPQWEELERISSKLSNCNDYDAITKVLNHKYKNLKEYLGVMLEVGKPLAKQAVENIKSNTQEEKEDSVVENNDEEQIVMEVQCSREQLNYLIIRYPDLDAKKSIFNLQPNPTRIRLGALTFSDIIKGWSTRVSINLPHLVIYREVKFKLKYTLVNKARTGERKFKDNAHPTQVQEMTIKRTVPVSKDVIMKGLDHILRACITNRQMFVLLHSIFDVMKSELDKMVDNMQVPFSYRAFASKYPYVRYLYSDEGQNNFAYDLQLEEVMSPIYMYHAQIVRSAYGDSILPPLPEWFKLECVVCHYRATGDTIMEIKESFLSHIKDHIGEEPDWKCTKCLKTFSLKFLTMKQWAHQCY